MIVSPGCWKVLRLYDRFMGWLHDERVEYRRFTDIRLKFYRLLCIAIRDSLLWRYFLVFTIGYQLALLKVVSSSSSKVVVKPRRGYRDVLWQGRKIMNSESKVHCVFGY